MTSNIMVRFHLLRSIHACAGADASIIRITHKLFILLHFSNFTFARAPGVERDANGKYQRIAQRESRLHRSPFADMLSKWRTGLLAALFLIALPAPAFAQNFSCVAAFTAAQPLAAGTAEDLYRRGIAALNASEFAEADRLFRAAFVRISDMTDLERARRLDSAVMGRILETSLARGNLHDAYFQLHRLQDIVSVRERPAWLSELMRIADDKTKHIPTAIGAVTAIEKCRSFGVAPKVNLRILFDFDSADLPAGSREALLSLAPELAQTKSQMIIVRGHTDASGSAEYNAALSLRRAQAVTAVLASSPAARSLIFKSEGAGESELLYAADDQSAAPLERRVEIRFE